MSAYAPQSNELSERADREWFEHIRKMTPEERWRVSAAASRALHKFSVAGLRLQYPDANEEELFRRAGARRLGSELTRRAFGAEAEKWLD